VAVWLFGFLLGTMFAFAGAPRIEPGENPLLPLWRDARWVESFLNYDSGLEPKLSAAEQLIYQNLEKDPALQAQPLVKAARLEQEITPSSSALLSYMVANLYLREGDTGNGVRHLRVAVEKHDRFLRAHRNLGLILARDGEFEEATKHLTRAVTLGGGDGLVLGLLGYSLLNQEHTLSAQVAYQQAVLLDPGNLDWRLGLIKTYVALGNYAPAVDLLDELIEKHPEREALWALQANVFVQLDQPQKAIVNLEAMRRLGRAAVPNLTLLGDLYLMQEAKDLALPVYLEAIEADAGQTPERALRAAEILAGRGAWTEARILMAKAREIFGAGMPEEYQPRLQKLEARAAFASGEDETGIRVLESVTASNPLDGEALLLAGDYYARSGQPEKAKFRYEHAAKIESHRADAWVKQAQLLVTERKYPEAVELLRRAQQLDPRDNIQRYLDRIQVAGERSGR